MSGEASHFTDARAQLWPIGLLVSAFVTCFYCLCKRSAASGYLKVVGERRGIGVDTRVEQHVSCLSIPQIFGRMFQVMPAELVAPEVLQ